MFAAATAVVKGLQVRPEPIPTSPGAMIYDKMKL